jgi:serine/threonine protein kinase
MSDTTVAHAPPWERPRPTWGFDEGDELAPGRTVLRRIGGGRRYEALLVWDEHRLAVLVAKVLRPDQATDAHARRDLVREATLLERLAHPVIVRSFGAAVDGRFPHLLLEHLEGPTLAELLARDGALALEQALPLALHLASALHYLAAERVLHLDVKPSNVVMGAPPRLIDHSVARTFHEAAAVRGPIGTDAYMAPEQRAGSGGLGPAADIWGLAATLRASLPRRTPAPLRDLVAAGLDPDPASRPTARAFAEALEPLVAALPRRLTLGRRA